MNKLEIKRGAEFAYTIWYENSFAFLAKRIKTLSYPLHKVCIITDDNVADLYLKEVKKELEKVYSHVTHFILPSGEENKTLEKVKEIYAHLITEHFDRKDMLVALGGGVIGDMTGFAAATYLRGIAFVQIPTTLLAQVDSSIGGKTGVDFAQYKNMVGAFHQPLLVYTNTATVSTLSEDLYACGMGEILKHGLIKDFSYYAWLTFHKREILSREPEIVREMIYRSNIIKKIVVENDPTEQGERALLNFGHTLGHAVEKLKNFTLLHGQCVSIGMVAALYLSMKKGGITAEEFREIQRDLRAFHLPTRVGGLQGKEIVLATKSDKKMDHGQIRFVLLKQKGEAYIDSHITDEDLLNAATVVEEV